MTLQPGSLLSHYRLVAVAGEGGMGVVWKAFDTTLGRYVALKVLPQALVAQPDRLAMFEREARVLAALNHPNIVTIHSVEEADGHRFLTMELVEGRTLADLIEPAGLPMDRLLEIALPLADAVAAAHRRGVVHRDLKPGNVMVGDGGRVKVLDFGLAKLSQHALARQPRDVRTWPNHVDVSFAGTLYYMAPEQVAGERIDERSDIFSLGVILYEMATGHRPFEAPSPPTLIASILRDVPAPPATWTSALPEAFVGIVLRCLTKKPDERPQSVEEVSQVLARLRADLDAGRTPSRRSIAVLPFADLSPDRNQAHFCDGVAEEILVALGRVPGLRVSSRASSFRYRSAHPDVQRISHRLQVSSLLAGTVRRAGDHVRITVELIDPAEGSQVWADRYDLQARDIFGVQDEIAARVVDALQVTLTAPERASMRRTSLPGLEAYEAYLRGRRLFYQYHRRDVLAARDEFLRATRIDPTYARAYAGLADCSAYLYLYAGRDPIRLSEARQATQRALEIDPRLAEAHASMGMCLSMAGRHDEAEQEFTTAVRLAPDLFEAHYFWARDAFARGKLEEAVEQYEAAMRARPDDYQSPLLMAQSCDDLGRHEEARAARERGVREAEEHLALHDRDARAWYMGANGLVALGQRERGLEWIRRALAIDPDDPMVLYNVACVYCLAEQTEEAIECLERAVDRGLRQRGWLEHDSNLDPIRADARFEALMARLDAPRSP